MRDESSGRPSIIKDDLVELVRELIMENCSFAITELSSHFTLLVAENCHGVPLLFITDDEMWVAHITLETMQQSMH